MNDRGPNYQLAFDDDGEIIECGTCNCAVETFEFVRGERVCRYCGKTGLGDLIRDQGVCCDLAYGIVGGLNELEKALKKDSNV